MAIRAHSGMQSAGYRSPTPTDERAHSRGWLALISGAPIAFDRVCRHDNRWPQYFELLAQVAKMPEAAERNVLLERLTRPEKSASALGARMNRAVGLVRQALATGGRALGSLEDDVSNAADQLLLIAIGASTPLPEPLKRSAAVTTPILLVRDGVAEDPMESHVADLTLWVVDALRRPRIEIHPAPASYLLYLDPDFKRGLRCVEQAIERRLVGTHQDDLPVLLWDIHPRRHNGRSPATCGLAGESASASFALTGLWLLRERLAHDVRHELMLAEPWHMAVSAAVSGDGDSLHAVEHLAYKLQALCDASGPYRRIHQVFAHFEQVHGSYQVAEIQGVKSLSELITRAAAATGGRMTASQRRLHDELLTTGHHTLSEAEMAEVAATAPTSLRTYLLFRYARWAIAAWRLDRWFVRLHLSRLSGRKQEDHELGEQDFHSLESLIRSCPQANGFVLVGEPGSGKTTLLGRWELDRTTEALLALGLGQGLPEVCIWVNLGEYPIGLSTVRGKAEALRAAAGDPAAQQRAHALVTPVDWLEQRWAREHPELPPIAGLAKSCRLRLLLDGLNEISTASPHQWQQAVTGLTESMRDAAWPMEPPIFSIRTRENTARLSHPGFDVYQVRLGRWTRAQMRHFCARRLGRRAIAFWRQLIRQPGMLELSSLPINLSAQCELYASSGGRIAASQAELFTALIRSRIEREFNGGRLDAAGLLDDEDRLVLNCGLRTAGGLPRLPDSGLLVKWLDSLAEQFRARACVRAERAVVDAVIKGKARREAWIRAVQGLGIAGIAAEDARFAWAHQLFLEYFQARALTRSRRNRQTLVPAPLTPEPLDDVVARLQADEMLPGVGASRSDEAFRLAVELADDPESWITRAETDNLLLAARAAASCMRRISVPTRRRLKTQLLARSRNPMVDVRERIEAAALIGALGGDDLRYEVMRSSGVPSMVPNEKHWIRTPAGPYSIGGGPGEDEGPAVEVTLPEFELAFAPVTCGEFARFIEAGGYDNPQWFPGDYAQRWWRGEVRNEEAIAFWLPRLKALAADFDRAVELYFAGEPQGYIEELRPYSKWSAEELAYQIEYRFGARKVRFPGRWQDPLLTQPLLPVTSICVIEARAYCLWLSRQTGWRIELPTEAMWEVAARGGTARPYPWDPSIEPVGRWHLNADPAHLRRNAPVGAFPAADTPSGLADMAGNVVQWTSSAYTPRLDAGVACAALADDDVRRTARGGDWSETVERCRATARFAQPAALRAPRLGFRIARIGP